MGIAEVVCSKVCYRGPLSTLRAKLTCRECSALHDAAVSKACNTTYQPLQQYCNIGQGNMQKALVYPPLLLLLLMASTSSSKHTTAYRAMLASPERRMLVKQASAS